MKNIIINAIRFYLEVLNILSPKIGGKHAFYVFCYPNKVKISKKQQSFLDTAKQFRLPVDNSEIQVYRWGMGPRKVLFVHGWQSNSFRWKDYIEALSPEEFTVYSFDAPGHGNSSGLISNVPMFVRSIEALLQHIKGVDAIVGHSVGSFSTLYYMNSNPTYQPNKIVSLASPGSVEDFVTLFLKTLKLSKRTVKNTRIYFKEYTGFEVAHFHINKMLTNIKPKGLIIHDQGDQDAPVQYSKYMNKNWENSTLILTEKLGHKLRSKEHVLQPVIKFLSEN